MSPRYDRATAVVSLILLPMDDNSKLQQYDIVQREKYSAIKAKFKLEVGRTTQMITIDQFTCVIERKEECPQTKILMNLNDYILTSSPQMVGLNEAWIIDKEIYVSPAIFQLLTDPDDSQTRKYVTSQLVVRTATKDELTKLKEKKSR